MRTITFYSYKGGVGRSLLVANTAKYLSSLGKTVVALDLDLEAPGLHYKFSLDSGIEIESSKAGVVDILVYFIKHKKFPQKLDDYIVDLEVAGKVGSILLMPAGRAPRGEYWRLLSQINWYEIFYGSNPIGVLFFLELKERLREAFNPDFLLIDARTGITEMGGIATTLMPDTVVCLALGSAEHLEGLREVLQGISHTAKKKDLKLQLLPVVSRLPEPAGEMLLLRQVQEFLEDPIHGYRLSIDQVFALHSEPSFDKGERLLIGGKSSPHELMLLRDYLRLFSKIVPAEDIRPHVGKLIQQALTRLLDDPDGAQSDLEALTTYCADEEAYHALLRIYQLRKLPADKILSTASLMWQFKNEEHPRPLLLEIISTYFGDPSYEPHRKKYAEFAETIWLASSVKDADLCMNIANSFLPEQKDRAINLLWYALEFDVDPIYRIVVRLLELLGTERREQALQIIERFKHVISVPQFYVAWARVISRTKEGDLAKQVINDPYFDLSSVQALAPPTYYRLLKLAGNREADDFLRAALDSAASSENLTLVRSLAEIFLEEGEIDELKYRLSSRLDTKMVSQLLSDMRKKLRHEPSAPWITSRRSSI